MWRQFIKQKKSSKKNFDNPPTLSDLAQQVRLSNRKLEQGFHQVFNTTVFGYLRQYRLKIAGELLREKKDEYFSNFFSCGL